MITSRKHSIHPTDSELLLQYVSRGDENAFRCLVERHGQLVQTVCRRVLGNAQDIEDAFQATFLILARDAGSIRCRDSLSAWLFQVARRIALRAAVKHKQQREQPLTDEVMISSETLQILEDRESFEILADELDRLPARYRTALILFYLEGRSRHAAAEELDCTAAAFKARLARGRRMLRQRLARRGLSISLVMAAVFTKSQAAATASLAHLIDQAVAAGLHFRATGQTAGLCSPHSVSLLEGVRPMTRLTVTKSTLVAGSLLAAGLMVTIGFGTALLGAGPKAQSHQQGTRISDTLDTHLAAPTVPARSRPLAVVAVAKRRSSQQAVSARPTKRHSPLPAQPSTRTDLAERSKAYERIEAALTAPTQFEFVDQPLKDAMNFFAEQENISILLDKKAMEDEGISPDDPVNLILDNVKLESALHLILKPLGLTYYIEDEVLKITPVSYEADRLEIRVYPVKDLSHWLGEEAVKTAVETQLTFREKPGIETSATIAHDFLIVSASQQQHRGIAKLLDQLRRAAALAEEWKNEP